MKLLVLSQLEGSPGTEVFLTAARAAGHEARLENPLQARKVTGDDGVSIVCLGSLDVDLVFTRMGSATPERGFDVLRQLELGGLRCVNAARPLRIARDKLATYVELAAADLPLPVTVLSRGDATAAEVADALGPPPWVWKHPIGTKGEAVELIQSAAELERRAADERCLLQRFVPEARGTDLRVLVIGGRAVAGMRRRARAGEWRSNLHRGGTGERIELTADLRDIAERAAAAVGLEVAGVDLLPGPTGPLIAEVNGSPGLAGLRAAVGDGFLDELFRFLARAT
ncbi:MAG: RimK family alpha-L-glutamate ligase [Planctomycetota bacterium]